MNLVNLCTDVVHKCAHVMCVKYNLRVASYKIGNVAKFSRLCAYIRASNFVIICDC